MKPSISVWTTSQLGYDQRIQRIISVLESRGATVKVWDRKTVDYPGGAIGTRWSGGPGMYLDYNRQIARLVRHHETDLIYAADIDVMPGLMWGLGNKRKIPLILDLHEWFPEVIELERKPIKKLVWQWIESRSVAFASVHMTVNQSLRKIFEEKYGKKFSLLRNVPSLNQGNQLSPAHRLENKILYYQGALNEGRGLKTAIEALHLLPSWRLWLVGKGSFEDEVKAKVKIEGVEDRVVFFGRKHPEKLRALAGQATVGLNLLRGNSKSYYYSLANRYFDFIHAGLPGIHMNFPEYENLLNENKVGLSIQDLSPESVAAAVRKMTNDNQYYTSIIGQCDLARLKYNWEKESKVLEEILERYGF